MSDESEPGGWETSGGCSSLPNVEDSVSDERDAEVCVARLLYIKDEIGYVS